jgi:hypothetical protein
VSTNMPALRPVELESAGLFAGSVCVFYSAAECA